MIVIYSRNKAAAAVAVFLNALGYETKLTHESLLTFPHHIEKQPETLFLVWAGPYRKMYNNAFPTFPNLAYLECGFLPHYSSTQLDSCGHGATSSAAQTPLVPINTDQCAKLDEYLEQYYWIKEDSHNITKYVPSTPFILFPVQHIQDSVIKYDAPPYAQNFERILRDTVQYMPEDCTLVVKQHPKSHHGHKLFQHNKIHYIDRIESDYDNWQLNHLLLKQSRAMVSVNSSFVFEALAHHTPTISLGRGVFSGKGITSENDKITEKTFTHLQFHEDTSQALLYDLCLNRQLANIDFTNMERVRCVWEYFCADIKAKKGFIPK
jgi:hypothetical protein